MYYRCLLMFLIAGALACVQDEKQCSNSRQCIPAEWWCDGRGDCDDGSDELNCDPCSRNPCLNHGTCYPTKFGFRCKCADPFAGSLCDKTICDPCSSDPCLNNGTCYGTMSGFRCNCLDEFGGTMCEKTLCAITECHTKADFVFVMDSSGSIKKNGGPEAYQHMKDFFKATVDALVKKGPIGGNGFRIGFVLFSLDVQIEFDLNEFDDAKKLKENIDSMPFMGTETSMKEALKVTREELLTPSHGERPGDDTPNIVILLTDGVSSDGNATVEAVKLKRDGAIIITVGVTDEIDEEQLKAISSRGEIIQVDDFAALNNLVQGIIQTICEEVGTVAPQPESNKPSGATNVRLGRNPRL